MGRLQDALNFFLGRGYSKEQAAGIVGNLHGESGMDIGAIGDGGKAYGLAQWHPDRQSAFKRLFGKDIRQSSFGEQLSFVDWELRNTEKRAGGFLAGATTVEGATAAFMKYYERPASMNSLGGRVQAAWNAIGLGNANSNPADADPSKSIGEKVTDAIIDADPTGTLPFMRDIFTGAMAARWTAVIIGILLIGVALVAFIMTTDTGKAAVKTAAKAAI